MYMVLHQCCSQQEKTVDKTQKIMYQSIPSLTIPPPPPPQGDPRGFANSSCPWGRVFALLSCPGVCPRVCPGGVLNQNKSSIILKKARFLLCLLHN